MQIRDYKSKNLELVKIDDEEFTLGGERITKSGLLFAIGQHEKAIADHADEIEGIKAVLKDMDA